MTKRLVVVGAGGFGRETLDVAVAMNEASPGPTWEIVGVADDNPTAENLERLEHRGVAFLGGTDDLRALEMTLHYAVGIGSPSVRRVIADKLDGAGLSASTLVHPAVTRGFEVRIGEGSVVCAGVRLTTNIRLGRHVHLNLNSTVGHDSVLGDFVSVNPLASISGDCTIGDDVLVGVAGVVLNGVSIGRGAVVGGSACVVRDVPEGVTVKGVPAK